MFFNHINPNPLGCVQIVFKLEDLGLLGLKGIIVTIRTDFQQGMESVS